MNTVKNVTIDLNKDEEYAVYWTLASLETCADAYHTPMGYKQFIFTTTIHSALLQIQLIILCILFLVLA